MSEPEGVRLQKVLSKAGVASRRAAEELIAEGRVSVDGKVVREFGTRVDPVNAVIHVDGVRVVLSEDLIYLAFNKPIGVHSTMTDDRGRPCVGDYVHKYERNANAGIFHVGRLDAETEHWESQALNWIEWARRPMFDAYWYYRERFFDLLPA
ncbi:S4 domain-containing protein, partial [Kibdelosporangium lantanae]